MKKLLKFQMSVGLKVAAMVVAFEGIMLVAYSILTNFFLDQNEILDKLQISQQNIVIVTLAGSLVLAGYLTFLVITRIFNPVRTMIMGTEEIIKGNLDYKLQIHTNDELQILAERFNTMTEALKAEKTGLENKVRERTRELEDLQKKELERQKDVLHLKDEFLFVAAHELRTPVTSIRWSLESVDKKKITKDMKQSFDDAIDASRNLSLLVEDLLNMARLDSKRIEFSKEPVDPVTAVENITKDLKQIAEKKGVNLVAQAGGALTRDALGDQRRIGEVLTNLVSNAVKFNKEGGHVSVSASEAGDMIRFTVEDDGPGIPPEEQQHLFEKFWRSKAQSGVEGSGLGLFITKRLVEGMNGSIGYESAPGRGTTFWVLLPSTKHKSKS